MTKQIINTGTGANSRDGDSLRNAFTKVNANFTELYDLISNIPPNSADTGNITFDSETIIGNTNVDFVNGLIRLVPNSDENFSSAGQFLNIYPTTDFDAPHIHVAAGLGGDLILGDDTHHIDINHSGNINIKSVDTVSGDSKNWQFDSDGNLILPQDGDILDSQGNSVLGSEGLPTVTIPAEQGTVYKGLQVSYGGYHSNPQSTTRNITKVVVHKPANAITAISDDSNDDFFQVSGIGTSDVLAMFVVFGDINEEKPFSDVQSFAESVIDNVILDNGVQGQYNTVDEMKTAFYGNFQALLSSVGGLATNFEFYDNYVPAINGGPTTVRQGSDALFDVIDNGNGTYSAGILNGGTDYLVGHKIKILGTSLGGVTPDNDIIIRVEALTSSSISGISNTGTAAGTETATYEGLAGTNYNVGTGFTANAVYANNSYVETSTWGSNYVVGDVITLLGANLTNGTTPENNFTITVTSIGSNGEPYGYDYENAGTAPNIWRANYIDDGGYDEYDSGNYINSSYSSNINYNDGETVADGTAAFGTGSSYSFVYQDSIFGLFVTGNSSTSISTSGGGGDSGATTVINNIYGPDIAAQTFDNAVTHINIIGDPYAGPLVRFTHTDNGTEIDVLIADDGDGAGVGITRENNQGIYNPYRDEGWSSSVSPSGTLWNTDGWTDFTNVESRNYLNLYAAFGNGGLGNKIVGTECVMYLPDNGKYYAVKFTQWTQNGNGGGFAYTRQELDLDKLAVGIRFHDGTRQTTAYVPPTTVKLSSPGERRIEEVYGYKQVSVTARTTGTTVTATAYDSNQNNPWQFNVSATGTEYDNLIALQALDGEYTVQVSIDETTWINAYVGGYGPNYIQIIFRDNATVVITQNQTVYYRLITGGDSVIWWDSSDLPNGSNNFRGAVIDYHAYTGEGTIIGTIHIVDDDGEENISHTEVSSGSSNLEYADLWHVTQEGEIRYRQLDGDSRTLKIQWTARVFYGSEIYD